MNKYLLMSAAAILSTAARTTYAMPQSPGASGHTSFYTTNGTGAAYCNEWSVKWAGSVYYANRQSLAYCGSGYAGVTSDGAALKGKVKNLGHTIQLPGNVLALLGESSSTSDFVVSGGLHTGSPIFEVCRGFSSYECPAGYIVLGQYAKAGKKLLVKGHGVSIQMAMQKYAKAHSKKSRE